MPDETTWQWRSGDAFFPKAVRDFLYTDLVRTRYFYLNYWSLMHFLSGLILGLILSRYFKDQLYKTWWVVFLIHSLWELWQIHIGMTDLSEPWKWTDILLDTVMTLSGFFLVCYSLKMNLNWNIL